MSPCALSPSLSLVPVEPTKVAISPGNRAAIHAAKNKVTGAIGGAAKAVGNAGVKAVNATGAAIESAGNKLQHRMDRRSAVKDPMKRQQLAADMKAENPKAIAPHLAGVTRRGAMGAGAALGAGLGFIAPGTDEEGNTKSRLMSAASGAATGATLGLGVGHLAKGHATRALKGQYDKNTTPGASTPITQNPALQVAHQPQAPAPAQPGQPAHSVAPGHAPLPPEYPVPAHARSRF